MEKESARLLKITEKVYAKINGEWFLGNRNLNLKCGKGTIPILYTLNDGVTKNTVQVPYENLRYESEKSFIEAEILHEKVKKALSLRNYVVSSLSAYEKNYLEAVEEFKSKFDKDPTYMIKWKSEDVVRREYQVTVANEILLRIKDDKPILPIIEEALNHLLKEQLRWVSNASTSIWSNAVEIAIADGRVRFIERLQEFVYEFKELEK